MQRVFFVSKKTCARFFFEFGDFIQTQVQNFQTHFFRKKNRNLKNTHTQSLEISPNADSKETKSRKHVFFTNQNEFELSLENSPNSSAEFVRRFNEKRMHSLLCRKGPR